MVLALAFLLINLIAAHLRRFRWSWKTLGIQLTHLGLIIILAVYTDNLRREKK